MPVSSRGPAPGGEEATRLEVAVVEWGTGGVPAMSAVRNRAIYLLALANGATLKYGGYLGSFQVRQTVVDGHVFLVPPLMRPMRPPRDVTVDGGGRMGTNREL